MQVIGDDGKVNILDLCLVLPHKIRRRSESTSCSNQLLSTPVVLSDHEEILRLRSPTRKRLNQSCAGRSATLPAPNTALIRRLDTTADSPDSKPYTGRPQMYCFENFILLVAVVQ
ncbi:hypothetical protein Y032_0713g1746 [Ancylostoma ceylanicum]|uniref:Uncharacterized protein n=1 Tax=Ancylostoma ceylanicum TaxID=53326 RepID=A0A016WGU8_9BILA|nr:hypothetical protein Y032_0713g1746 [Ancylostoma ceylanicum]